MRQNTSQLKKNIVAGLLGIVSGALLFGVIEFIHKPSLPVHVDRLDHAIEKEETPLEAAPVIEKKTTSNTSTRKVSLGKASTKSYTRKLPDKVTTSTRKTSTAASNVKTVTTVEVQTTEKYTKGSKKKVVKTKTRTTVVTTTTRKQQEPDQAAPSQSSSPRTVSVRSEAPGMPSHILNAFESLGFRLVIDPSFQDGDGAFHAKTRTITMREEDSSHVYHELGHFLAFTAGNADNSSSFRAIYKEEKSSFQGTYRGYAGTNPQEFFAECVREYVLHPAALLASCPKAYAAVEAAMAKITISQVAAVQKSYARVWAND